MSHSLVISVTLWEEYKETRKLSPKDDKWSTKSQTISKLLMTKCLSVNGNYSSESN